MIEPGKLYRRKSDGAKLMALKQDGLWLFFNLSERDPNPFSPLVKHLVDEVEPWCEPRRKTVEGWAYLRVDGCGWGVRLDHDGRFPDVGVPVIARKRFTVELVEGEFDE